MRVGVLGGTVILILAICAPDGSAVPELKSSDLKRIEFSSAVANIDFDGGVLERTPIRGVVGLPDLAGESWHGRIIRRIIDGAGHRTTAPIPFMIEYVQGRAARAWCDVNFDGKLEAEELLQVYSYPGDPQAQAFLVDLAWATGLASESRTVRWKARVILDPPADSTNVMTYRVQLVYAMVGTAEFGGKPHRVFLFDGDSDGIYSKGYGDGVFVDLNDDRYFKIDFMSPEFGPLSVPFRMGEREYEAIEIDPRGNFLILRDIGPASPFTEIRPGSVAPDFAFESAPGETLRLSNYRGRYLVLYFWASWCGACDELAPELQSIYQCFRPAGLEILSVSYDSDRQAMEEFRRRHSENWPVSFAGRRFHENPIGELYQASFAGVAYLIEPRGHVDGIYADLHELGKRLREVGLVTANAACP